MPARPAIAPLFSNWARILACAGVLGACGEAGELPRTPAAEASLRVVSTHPAAGEVIHDARAIVDLCFSHRLDPASLSDDRLRLRSGFVFYDVDQELELINWRDRGGEEIAETSWCEGSVLRLDSGGTLPPGVTYRVILEEGLRAWTGETLDTQAEGWVQPIPEPIDTDGEIDPEDLEPYFAFEFHIDPDANVPEPEPIEAPTLASLFAPGAVFSEERDACSCHRQSDTLAMEVLDLSSPSTTYEALVEDSRVRSTGYPMVTPNNAATSYLMHTLVHHDEGALPSVLGDPMPPAGSLPTRDIGAIAAWIRGGAKE